MPQLHRQASGTFVTRRTHPAKRLGAADQRTGQLRGGAESADVWNSGARCSGCPFELGRRSCRPIRHDASRFRQQRTHQDLFWRSAPLTHYVAAFRGKGPAFLDAEVGE